MLRGLFSVLLFLGFYSQCVSAGCPCEEAPIEYRSVTVRQALCVVFEKGVASLSNSVEKAKQSLLVAGKDVAAGVEEVVFLGEDYKNDEKKDKGCNVLFRLRADRERSETSRHARVMCPGKCEAIPELSLPIGWFTSSDVEFNITEDIHLSCSLSLFQFLRGNGMKLTAAAKVPLAALLGGLYRRRIQECYEQKHWAAVPEIASKEDVEHDRRSRRKVESLVIWVGSKAQESRELVLHQSQTLLGQPPRARRQCSHGQRTTASTPAARTPPLPGRPHSNKRYNSACQCRRCYGTRLGSRAARPLRALAHVLLLFDPAFVVLVDDDTYVNYPLLVQRFGPALRTSMSSEPIVLGELMGRTGPEGHVSRGGFAVGGSGYVLGKETLHRLHARSLAWLGGLGLGAGAGAGQYNTSSSPSLANVLARGGEEQDTQRSTEQAKYLSVLAEAVNALTGTGTGTGCGGGAAAVESCLGPIVPTHRTAAPATATAIATATATALASSTGGQGRGRDDGGRDGMVVPTKRRLIDVCASLMSGEHTCQHSDHAMGRCLLYGAHAAYVNVLHSGAGRSAAARAVRNVLHGAILRYSETCNVPSLSPRRAAHHRLGQAQGQGHRRCWEGYQSS